MVKTARCCPDSGLTNRATVLEAFATIIGLQDHEAEIRFACTIYVGANNYANSGR